MQRVQNEFLSSSLSFGLKTVYLYARGFLCLHCFALQELQSSSKRSGGMHPFIATSVEWGELGKLTQGKWEGMKNQENIKNCLNHDKSPTPGLFVQYSLKKPTFTNGSNEVTLLTFCTISKEFFLHFHRGLFFKGNINEMYYKHKACFCLYFSC